MLWAAGENTHLIDTALYPYEYYKDYIREGYAASPTNQTIFNFKKKAGGATISDKESYYREQAIQEISNAFIERISQSSYKDPIALITIPVSSNDDRLIALAGNIQKSCHNIVYLKDAITSSSTTAYSKSPESKRNVTEMQKYQSTLTLNVTLQQNLVLLVDDVITTGLHYRACAELIKHSGYPGYLYGLFYGKTKSRNNPTLLF